MSDCLHVVWFSFPLFLLCAHMVTVVTVTVFYVQLGFVGRSIKLAGEEPKGNREKGRTQSSLAYTQTIVRLYPISNAENGFKP